MATTVESRSDAAGPRETALDDGVAATARARGVLLGQRPARRLGLRARVTAAFALGALLLSALLAGTTYLLTRSSLLDARERNILRQTYLNARQVQQSLPREPDAMLDLLTSLLTPTGSNPVIVQDGEFFASSAQFGQAALPAALRSMVLGDDVPGFLRYQIGGRPQMAVGIPLPGAVGVDAAYFEIVDLSETEATLRALGLSLLGASVLTTLAGAAVGRWASRRTLRPLADVSLAAEAIAGGRLDTRLETIADPDLGVLSASFNDMAQALQERIERDARFTSDVSHELRSPLMTMAAAVEVLESQRGGLEERSQQAVDLVTAEVGRFRQLVEDLLEISRYDAGAVDLQADDLRLAEFVLQAVAAAGYRDVPIEIDADLAEVVVAVDKRRLARVVANLMDNAAKYGEGASTVSLRKGDGVVQLAVEDLGPGVPEEERTTIFDRFNRGGVAGRRGSSEGVGLGLALVAEHVRLHGGRVFVEDRTDGRQGARFVVELPAELPEPEPEPAGAPQGGEP